MAKGTSDSAIAKWGEIPVVASTWPIPLRDS